MPEDTKIIIGVAVLSLLLILLGFAPGHIARHRRHPSKDAINLCGWLGLFFPILWLIGVIWAHTGPDLSKQHPRATRPSKRNHRLTRRQWDAVDALEEMS